MASVFISAARLSPAFIPDCVTAEQIRILHIRHCVRESQSHGPTLTPVYGPDTEAIGDPMIESRPRVAHRTLDTPFVVVLPFPLDEHLNLLMCPGGV